MSMPLVSICLPTLNSFPFLEERVDSIFKQSYKNWELIINDSFSEDGTWELLQRLSKNDKRLSTIQSKREGPYPAWNNCLFRSKGQYVYIATSDDTMAIDCIEKLLMALEKNQDCDIAHCKLVKIDKNSRLSDSVQKPQETVFGDSVPELLERPHLRRAPFDGLLHLLGVVVYESITQLLIRRTLFSKIGNFPIKWGSLGDFNWEMKAGLVANTVHVPCTWASWRVHPNQATALVNFDSVEHERKIEEMIYDALQECEQFMPVKVVSDLKLYWFEYIKEMRRYYAGLRLQPNKIRRRIYQTCELLRGTKSARLQWKSHICGGPKWRETVSREIREWLESLGIETAVLIAS